jgi:hypothetical protein
MKIRFGVGIGAETPARGLTDFVDRFVIELLPREN